MTGMRTDPLTEAAPRPEKVVTIREDATVYEAAARMRDHRVGAVIVIDEIGKVVGIATERDLVNSVLSAGVDPGCTRVREIMTSDPTTCLPGTSFVEAQAIMTARRIRHLPVVNDLGMAVGMISGRDVMEHQAMADRERRSAAEQVAMLSRYLKSLDFDEVVDVITHEVPKIFWADKGVLFFPPEADPPDRPAVVSRHKCPCTEDALARRHSHECRRDSCDVHCGDAPGACGEPPCVSVPLKVRGLNGGGGRPKRTSTGLLCLCGLGPPGAMTRELVLYKAELIRDLLNANLTNARMYQKARRDAMTDALTHVGSRRAFEEQLDAEVSRSTRYKRPLCVVMVDVDGFKSINDEFGHTKGDEVLRAFARLLDREKRTADCLARYGGDEFVLLMPETALDGAVAVAERIRAQTGSIVLPNGRKMTVSCGVSERSSEARVPANELVRHADLALYEAKKGGRNRVVTWPRVSRQFSAARQVDQERIEELQRLLAEMSVRSKEVFVQSIWCLVQALEARDRYTRSHSENVMRYAVAIAQTMGFPEEHVAVVRRAAAVHDIGKIGVPDRILRKAGQLTPEERKVMQQHPLIAVGILDPLRFLEREVPIVRHHHERWDGKGYPDGNSGKAIPQGARLLAVADAFDAITSDRVYRRSRPVAQALEILVQESTGQFDAEAVEAMLRWVDQVRAGLDKTAAITVHDLLESQKACTVAA